MKVHWISPYRKDKNIGKAVNDAVAQLNAAPEDWIVLTDHDVLWLLPNSKRQVMAVLETTDYDLLGCMTNRLGLQEALVPLAFDVDNISSHIGLARGLQRAHGLEVKPVIRVAAMMMCFRVGLWQKLGGFMERQINFDLLFSLAAHRRGHKLGLMTGVYVLHLYRWGSERPERDTKHLGG